MAATAGFATSSSGPWLRLRHRPRTPIDAHLDSDPRRDMRTTYESVQRICHRRILRSRSRQDVSDDLAVDVGQAEVAARVAEGQLLVVEAEQVQDRGMEVVHAHQGLHGLEPEVIGRAVDRAALDAAPGEPDGEPVVVVVPAELRLAVAVE